MISTVLITTLAGTAKATIDNLTHVLSSRQPSVAITSLPPNHVIAVLALIFWTSQVQDQHIAGLHRSLVQGLTETTLSFVLNFDQQIASLQLEDMKKLNMLRQAIRDPMYKMLLATAKTYAEAFDAIMSSTSWELALPSTPTSSSTQNSVAYPTQSVGMLPKPTELPKPANLQVNAVSVEEANRLSQLCNTLEQVEKQFRSMIPVDTRDKHPNPHQRQQGHSPAARVSTQCTYCSKYNHTEAVCRKKERDTLQQRSNESQSQTNGPLTKEVAPVGLTANSSDSSKQKPFNNNRNASNPRQFGQPPQQPHTVDTKPWYQGPKN